MKREKSNQFHFALLSLESLLALGWLVSIPGDPGNAAMLGLSAPRLALAAGLLLAAVGFGYLAARMWRGDARAAAHGENIAGMASKGWGFALALVVFGGALFALLNWRYAPAIYEARLLRLAPAYLFAAFFASHLLVLGWARTPAKSREAWLLAVLSAVLVGTYLAGTLTFSQHNSAFDVSDQGAQIEFARTVRSSGFRFTGGRNFMPGYAFVQALFVDVGANPEAIYARGKLVNIGLSLAMLVGLFLLVRQYFHWVAAYWFAVLAAFSIFMYKAAYFQPELLFYFLFFVSFLLMVRLLVRPDWRLAALLGVVAALAQLTKASVLPAVVLFAGMYGAKILWGWWQSRESTRAQLLSVGVTLALFLAVLSPYILESKRVYGQYFYNVNTTFYAWYDSWREAKAGTRAHGDGVGWPDLPPEEIPSPAKYLREHSVGDIANRLVKGLVNEAQNLWVTFSWVSYPILYVAVAGFAALLSRERARKLLKHYRWAAAFALLLLVGYLLLFAWYAPIADYSDIRFSYGLHLPILFICFLALGKLFDGEVVYRVGRLRARGRVWMNALHGFAALLMTSELIFILPQKLNQFQWYGK